MRTRSPPGGASSRPPRGRAQVIACVGRRANVCLPSMRSTPCSRTAASLARTSPAMGPRSSTSPRRPTAPRTARSSRAAAARCTSPTRRPVPCRPRWRSSSRCMGPMPSSSVARRQPSMRSRTPARCWRAARARGPSCSRWRRSSNARISTRARGGWWIARWSRPPRRCCWSPGRTATKDWRRARPSRRTLGGAPTSRNAPEGGSAKRSRAGR